MCEKCGAKGMEMIIAVTKCDGSKSDVLLRVSADMDHHGRFDIEADADKMPLVMAFFTAAAAAVIEADMLAKKANDLMSPTRKFDA